MGSAEPPQLILLISCDTMRADHLPIYGYGRDTTPNLRAFATEAVVFDQAFTPEPWTPSAHMSMLTGLYPRNHGITANINADEDIETLPEALKKVGYRTAGHAGMQWWFLPWRGFAQGFDEYTVPPNNYRNVFETFALGMKFIENAPESRTFLFLHNYDLHSHFDGVLPYGPKDPRFDRFARELGPPPSFAHPGFEGRSPTALLGGHNNGKARISGTEREYMKALYDDALLKVDFALGAFFDRLKQLGLYDKALIIVTSDHGEAFGDHDRYMHGDIYENTVRVPMIVRFPGGRHGGERVGALVTLMDLYPTILREVGVSVETPVDGYGLHAALAGTPAPDATVFLKRGPWRGARTPVWKLVEDRAAASARFFDLLQDPGELHDLAPSAPAQLSAIAARQKEFFAPPAGGWKIAFRAGAGAWHTTFRVASAGRLKTVALENGYFEEKNDEVSEARELQGKLDLRVPAQTDTLHVLGVDPAVPVRLTLSSDQPFSIVAPGKIERAETEIVLQLDPTAAPAATRTNWPAELNEGPAITYWYVPAERRGSEAPALPADAVENLDSLGYFGAN